MIIPIPSQVIQDDICSWIYVLNTSLRTYEMGGFPLAQYPIEGQDS